VALIALVILVRHRQPALRWTMIALGFMLLAFPILFFAFTEPVNTVFRAATPDAVPANWEQLRRQWEYSHLARFFCHLIAFSALVTSVLVETQESNCTQ
jgi:hypothetical protein